MIRLGGFNGPNLTDNPRVLEARRVLFEYLRRPAEERAERRLPIDESIFYDPDIHSAVHARSLGKCVFCESAPDGNELIDHYRPLRAARDLQGSTAKDFYAWLAYEFDNLILICRKCAISKGNSFPVDGERAPFIASLPEVRRLERPLVIDPYRDQPDHALEFLFDGWCEPIDLRGRVTIITLNLNRPELIEGRAAAISQLLEEIKLLLEPSNKSFSYSPELINLGQPFAGVRLNVLRRLVKGLTFRGHSIEGTAASVPGRLVDVVRSGLSFQDRDRLFQRIDDLRRDDSDRDHWDGDLGVEIETEKTWMKVVTPWRFVEPKGGLGHIQIQNFRNVQSVQIDIPYRRDSKSASCLMLLGENGVGKSSILQAIALGLLGGEQARRLKVDPMDLLRSDADGRWDQLTPENAYVALGFRRDHRAYFRLDALTRRIIGNEPTSSVVLGYGPRRFFDPTKSERVGGAYSRVLSLFRPTATIPYPGTWLNQLGLHEFREVAQVIRVVLALSDDDELVRDLDGRICIKLGQKAVPLEWLSEGYRSVFVMIADIARELLPMYPNLQDAEAIVLIDEIETHLHPRWKMRVMAALRRALPQVQFIVTTHDPLCLRGMDDGEVVVLQRAPDNTIRKLEDLPSTKGMRADQLLTSDYFGLSSTIDPQTELDMAKYVQAVSESPEGMVTGAEQLVAHLTIGNDAQEQVIHLAMRKFITERERPTDQLRSDVSEEAMMAVLAALKGERTK